MSTTNFSLTDSQTFTDSSVYSFGSSNSVVVTEIPVTGWQLTSIQCTETSTGLPNTLNTTVDLANHSATIIAEQGEQIDCTFTSDQSSPTVAPVNVSGRVMNYRGQGVRGATLVLYDADSGTTVYARTNSFGYYSFSGITAGHFCTVTVQSTSKYSFSNSTRSLTPTDNIANLDFYSVKQLTF
jgi:hypothetical protein